MAGSNKFGPQYLQALLRSNPGTTEELAQQKAKIEEYFRSQAKEGKTRPPGRSVPMPGAAKAKKQQLANQLQYKQKLLLTWSVLLTVPALLMVSRLTDLPWLLPLLLIMIGLFLWQTKKAFLSGFLPASKGDYLAVATRSLVKEITNAREPRWSRSFGESAVPAYRQKWTKFQSEMDRLLAAGTLDDAFGPAEECLSVLNYFEQIKRAHTKEESVHETVIDPVNTLIERLCQEHEWQYADKLTVHYLFLLNPDCV